MKNSLNDTICAISTPLGSGGISIVRMSGDQSVNILKKIFKGKTDDFKSHRIYYGNIYDGSSLVDEVLVSVMLGKHTFTAEDVVEINCHGGIKVTQKVLELLLNCGTRLAENGEFTKRAFLNGRIDLTTAEATKDVIDAVTDMSLENASNNLNGRLKNEIVNMREQILLMIANIEASIDYPEHDMEENNFTEILSSNEIIIDKIKNLLSTFERGKIMRDGISTAIIGRANVGKSSLLNILVGEEKAIVTDIAGTTRDVITEYININDIALKIIDTAGIRETSDIVEKIGVEKSIKTAQDADLVLYVVDGSEVLSGDDKDIIDKIKHKKVITIINKTDLKQYTDKQYIKDALQCEIVEVSALKEEGMEKLYEVIKNIFFSGDVSFGENTVMLSNARHKNCLVKVNTSLQNCNEGIMNGLTEDLIVIDLTDSYNYLGEILGENMDEDIIDKIFSEFCLGK